MLLISFVTTSTSAQHNQDSEQAYYTVDGDRIELEVVGDEISFGLAPGEDLPDRFNQRTTQEGFAVKVSRLGAENWRFQIDRIPPNNVQKLSDNVAKPPSQALVGHDKEAQRLEQHDRLRQMFADMTDDPAVAWSYPAYRNTRTGTLVWLTPRIIAEVAASVDVETLEDRLPAEVRLVRPLAAPNQVLVELVDPRSDNPLDIATRLAADFDWIIWAVPDFIQHWQRSVIPNDTLFSNQWHLQNTGQGGGITGADARLPGAWDLETGDPSVIIAIVDDGVQTTHPDLSIFTNTAEIPGNGVDDDSNGFIDDVNGWDFLQDDNDPNPVLTGPGSHGTAVAGVAAAIGNNGIGVSGACQECSILPVRIGDDTSFASDAVIADAINYAGELADVLNNSWGGGSPSPAITSAIQNVVTNGSGGLGSPVFFANGNSASGYFDYSLNGIPSGTWTFTWTYEKDFVLSRGFDTTWLDNVVFPDGSVEDFETCSALPPGWSTSGDASWFAVDDETRASSSQGGNCSIQAGDIGDNETTSVSVTKTLGVGGALTYRLWTSSETALLGFDGEGPLTDQCYDFSSLTLSDGTTTYGPFFIRCGTWSNQGNPLQDGAISYPSSVAEAISVGAATNFDRRSDYSQWGPEIDFVCHSSGGSLGITTTDIAGTNGYDVTDYTSTFGGTSSASPLCAGIAALAVSSNPGLTATQVRDLMRQNTRQIGTVPYDGSGWNSQYGFGSVDATEVLADANVCSSLNLSGLTIADTRTYEACDTLSANDVTIESTANVTFRAGTAIIIGPPFSVASGANFVAQVITPP